MNRLLRIFYNYRLTRFCRPDLGRLDALRLARVYASWGL